MFPKYRHPHVYSTYESDEACLLCRQLGAYRIKEWWYCDACVASEKAYQDACSRDDSSFINDMDLSDHPPIRKWQEWSWPHCCGEPMIYVCELSKETIRSYCRDEEPDQFIQRCMPDCDEGMDYYRGLRNVDQATEKGDYDMMLHYFECTACKKEHIQFDAS